MSMVITYMHYVTMSVEQECRVDCLIPMLKVAHGVSWGCGLSRGSLRIRSVAMEDKSPQTTTEQPLWGPPKLEEYLCPSKPQLA